MVVMVVIRMRRRALKILRSTPRASVLFAGLASVATQSGSISLLPGSQLGAIERLTRGLQPRPIEPATHGDFLPPAGELGPPLTFDISLSLTGLADALGVDPAIGGSLNSTFSGSADQFGVADSITAPATVGITVPAATRTACEQLPQQLQTSVDYWNDHFVAGPPVQLAANPSTDLTRGPGGDTSNLPLLGPAGAWCRPSPVPFADSSPLASRTFWTPIALVLCAVAVLWLSRGVRLPD